MKNLKKFRFPTLIFSIFLALPLVSNASAQGNVSNCSVFYTGINISSIECGGTQEFPDDGYGNVPVTLSGPLQNASVTPNGELLTASLNDYSYANLAQIGTSSYLYTSFSSGLSGYGFGIFDNQGNYLGYIPQDIAMNNYGTIIDLSQYPNAAVILDGATATDTLQDYLNDAEFQSLAIIPYTSGMPIQDTHFGIVSEFAFALAAFWLILWIFKKKI